MTTTGTDGGKRGLLPTAKYTEREESITFRPSKRENTEMGGEHVRQVEINDDKIKEAERARGKKLSKKLYGTSLPERKDMVVVADWESVCKGETEGK